MCMYLYVCYTCPMIFMYSNHILMDNEDDNIVEFPLCLPGPLVFHFIMSYFSAIDLGRVMQVSKTLRNWIVSDSVLWRKQCQKVWLCDSKDEEQSWYDKWLSICSEWHPYINCYSKIKTAWMKINRCLELKCPAAIEQFNSGILEQQVKRIENVVRVKVPVEYSCFLRLCNGMKCNVDGISFMGSVNCYGTTFKYVLYSNEKMMALTQVIPVLLPRRKVIDPHNIMDMYLCIGGDVHDRGGWLLLSVSTKNHELAGHVFQVNSYLHSFAKPVPFSDWLVQEANQMELYSIEGNTIHRFLFKPEYVAVTGYFTVRVGTMFDPSKLNEYTTTLIEQEVVDVRYAYRIEIFMDENAPYRECCWLDSRHWLIKFSNDSSTIVDGPGVVGQQPTFRPGSCHKYISCTYFHNEWCSMEGYFTMRYHSMPGSFRIAIPKFTMYKPELSYLA